MQSFGRYEMRYIKTARRQVNNAIIQQYVLSYSLWNVLACKYNTYRVLYVLEHYIKLHYIIY